MAKQWQFRRDGFSMIELLFAMVLLTVVVMGVVKLQTGNLALSNTQNNEIQAHFLANQGVEVVKALGKTLIGTKCVAASCTCKLTKGSDYDLVCPSGPEILDLFERTIQIETDAVKIPSAFKVTSIVEWVDSTGEHRRYENGDPTKTLLNGQAEANLIVF